MLFWIKYCSGWLRKYTKNMLNFQPQYIRPQELIFKCNVYPMGRKISKSDTVYLFSILFLPNCN